MRRKTNGARALDECRRRGWMAQSVQVWVPKAGSWKHGTRRDLFGFIDIIALGGARVVGIQACGFPDLQAHIRRLREPEVSGKMRIWLDSGARLLLWSFKEIAGRFVLQEFNIGGPRTHGLIAAEEVE